MSCVLLLFVIVCVATANADKQFPGGTNQKEKSKPLSTFLYTCRLNDTERSLFENIPGSDLETLLEASEEDLDNIMDAVQLTNIFSRQRLKNGIRKARHTQLDPVRHPVTNIPKPLTRRLGTLANTSETYHRTVLVDEILEGYNIKVPPIAAGARNLSVNVGINFYAISNVDTAAALAAFNIWLRMSWTDPRLSWNPDDYGGVSYISLAADAVSIEQSQIWVPDYELFNAEESLHAFSGKDAMIWSDGSIFLSRPGIMRVQCDFKGLDKFPFDSPSCAMEMGGWAWSGSFVDYNLMGDGFSTTPQVEKSTYIEYSIASVSVHKENLFYPCCPDDPWPTLYFKVVLNRAKDYYSRSIVFPIILFTYLSFMVFWMDQQSGERLGFGVTMVLTSVAIQLLVVDNIPVCDSMLWYDSLALTCQVFTFFTIVESILVQYIYFRPSQNIKFTAVKIMYLRSWLARHHPNKLYFLGICCSQGKVGERAQAFLARRKRLRGTQKTKQRAKKTMSLPSTTTALPIASATELEDSLASQEGSSRTKHSPPRSQAKTSEPSASSAPSSPPSSCSPSAAQYRANLLRKQSTVAATKESVKYTVELMARSNAMKSLKSGKFTTMTEREQDNIRNWAALRIQHLFHERRSALFANRVKQHREWLHERGLSEEQEFLCNWLDQVCQFAFPTIYTLVLIGLFASI